MEDSFTVHDDADYIGRTKPMGTSTSHRSPATPEWDRVRDLYRSGEHDPAEVSRRIAQALSPDTRAAMSAGGPSACLDALLSGVHAASSGRGGHPLEGATCLLGAASALRRSAERRIVTRGLSSLYTELALDALSVTALRVFSPPGGVAAPWAAPGRWDVPPDLLAVAGLSGLAGQFVEESTGRYLGYLVSRDVAEFVGSEGLPTVEAATSLAQSVAQYGRAVAGGLGLRDAEDRLNRAVVGLAEPERLREVSLVFAGAVAGCLANLSGGPS